MPRAISQTAPPCGIPSIRPSLSGDQDAPASRACWRAADGSSHIRAGAGERQTVVLIFAQKTAFPGIVRGGAEIPSGRETDCEVTPERTPSAAGRARRRRGDCGGDRIPPRFQKRGDVDFVIMFIPLRGARRSACNGPAVDPEAVVVKRADPHNGMLRHCGKPKIRPEPGNFCFRINHIGQPFRVDPESAQRRRPCAMRFFRLIQFAFSCPEEASGRCARSRR